MSLSLLVDNFIIIYYKNNFISIYYYDFFFLSYYKKILLMQWGIKVSMAIKNYKSLQLIIIDAITYHF